MDYQSYMGHVEFAGSVYFLCLDKLEDDPKPNEDLVEFISRHKEQRVPVNILRLYEGDLSVEVYYHPIKGYTSDEFLVGKIEYDGWTWCLITSSKWFVTLEKMQEQSSIEIPCSNSIEIAVLALW